MFRRRNKTLGIAEPSGTSEPGVGILVWSFRVFMFGVYHPVAEPARWALLAATGFANSIGLSCQSPAVGNTAGLFGLRVRADPAASAQPGASDNRR